MDNQFAKISVIMPVYNGESFLLDSIRSVLDQTYKNLELIIIDDGSTDGGKDIIFDIKNRDNRVKYLYKDNSGQGSARNLGIKNSEGSFIAFIDSDDVWEKEKIEKQILFFENNKDANFLFCDSICFGDDRFLGRLGSSFSAPFSGFVIKKLLKKNLLQIPQLF